MSRSLRQAAGVLSLVVMLGVFWSLKLTGITMAGEAFCGMDEHVHGESCPTGTLTCGLEETEGHVHSEACILRRLDCELPEILPHVHTEACMEHVLVCTLEEQEGHIHDETCRKVVQVCTLEEREGHVHDETCYERNLICSAEEEDPEHIHGEDCYESVLICSEEECEGHTHTEDCFALSEEVYCGLEECEGHFHDDTCYLPVEGSFICGQEECEGHLHTEECYYVGVGFGCGLYEADGHVHTRDCLTEETELGCGMEYIEPHVHTEECSMPYAECPLVEHIHTESCYSDINADLETEDDWEDSLRQVEEETSTGEMVAAVALSQLGNGESERNFEVDDYGNRRGITRYGQWYGNPYGDWSAMFASFCLHYAGAADVPANAGPEAMRLEWEAEALYSAADEYRPRVGDLVFLQPVQAERADDEELTLCSVEEPAEYIEEEAVMQLTLMADGSAEVDAYTDDSATAIAIVTEVDEYGMTVVQGDVDGSVEEVYYESDDAAILGYGLVPESSPYALLTASRAGGKLLADTINYTSSTNLNDRSFILYTQYGGQYYAVGSVSGSGYSATTLAVPITVVDGLVYSDIADTDSLFWKFTGSGSNYGILNQSTGRALHPGASENGVIYDSAWETMLISAGNGARFVHTSGDYGVYFNYGNGNPYFARGSGRSNATILYLAESMPPCTVWLDGTQGDLMSLRGSDLTEYSVTAGDTLTLPSEWKTPAKYSYTLKGWYSVADGAYYAPGEEITVTENMLLFADWEAATYDIGKMNDAVADTISTDSFIKTSLFDYNSLFNTLSQNNDYDPAVGGNSTDWTLVQSGTVAATGEETQNFVFVDYDAVSDISYAGNRNKANASQDTVTAGLYNAELASLLFDPQLDVVGKTYVGTGDYLFRYGADPTDGEHYGYYYYDSRLNAASYNQSEERFYVYDYLERTTDSTGGEYTSDFLPFNSPYANTNGKTVGAESTGYYYDAKYSNSANSTDRVGTNYAFGMAMEINFYLPSAPGTTDSEGNVANQSITGENMVFEFAGDDDMWVLVDGTLMLDIGGIHGIQNGSIDFSSGTVTVAGTVHQAHSDLVKNLEPGSHTLTMYYLERGASKSNFKLRFNLSTRYHMSIRKEDTLTAHLLNGAVFAVYTDEECTQAAELWPNREAHENNQPPTNIFTVVNGKAEMWGLAAGNTYYFVETVGPDGLNGVPAKGIIRMRLNNQGDPDYEILPDGEDNLTVGYMVHGYKVDEDKQEAYLVVTNTDAYESEPTAVYVEKAWSDSENHDGDSVTVYLVANGASIQPVTLNKNNGWKYTWTNLPSTDRNGEPVDYTVREATVPGYIGLVSRVDPSASDDPESSGSGSTTVGSAVSSLENGKTYLLYTKYGYIGTESNVIALETDQATALSSNGYLWDATVHSDGRVTLTNKAGMTIYWHSFTLKIAFSSPGTSTTDPGNNASDKLYYTGGTLQHCITEWSQWHYPVDENVLSAVTYNQRLYTTNSGTMLAISAQPLITEEPPAEEPEEEITTGNNFRITNVPVGEAVVSLKVTKAWSSGGLATEADYQSKSVRMDLLADGEEAGLHAVLNLQNGWTYTFTDLPMCDANGEVISYTVKEHESDPLWRAEYGPVTSINGSQSAYQTTVTNVYRATVILPSTGSFGRRGYELLGLSVMLGGLGWYVYQKHKAERRGRL